MGREAKLPDAHCPCCGQVWPADRSKAHAERVLASLTFAGPVQTRIIEHLTKNFGSWVHRKRLIDAVYHDDPDGGPDDANNCIAVTVNRIRHLIKPLGLVIDGEAWRGSRLRWRS